MNTEKKFFPKLYPLDKKINREWFIKYKTRGVYKIYKKGFKELDTIEERIAHFTAIVEKWQQEGKKTERKHINKSNNTELYLLNLMSNNIELKKHNYRPKTYLAFHSILGIYSKFMKINDYKNHMLWIDYQKKQGLSNRTIHHRIITIKSFYKELILQKHTKINPFETYKKLSYASTSKMYFTKEQTEKIKTHILEDKKHGALAGLSALLLLLYSPR